MKKVANEQVTGYMEFIRENETRRKNVFVSNKENIGDRESVQMFKVEQKR